MTLKIVHDGGRTVEFVSPDGMVMFAIQATDERTIQIRGVDTCKIGGKFYGAGLEVLPEVSNGIRVRASDEG